MKYIFLGIFLLLVIGGGVFVFGSMRNSPSANPVNKQTTTTNDISSPTPTSNNNSYSMEEVAKHDNQSDCWLVIEGNVYDVTSFISEHPGGNEILKGCGNDATSLFKGEREHAEGNASSYLPQFLIGKVQ